ncbi:type VII secretion-associated serine protease mycosin, partial [Streptomyces sp. NPDC060131]
MPIRTLTAAVLAATVLAAPTVLTFLPAAPAARAADGGQCTFPSENYEGRPWALQRVNLDELWAQTKGKGVRVAVIDTGVDVKHPQLADAVDASKGKN